MGVLNPRLHRRLAHKFGHVKVSNEGEAMICQAVKKLNDEPELLVAHAGEYYQVCCPYCQDTRHRLYVNHRFGQLDAYGRRLFFLATCFNEGCLSSRDNFKDFLEQLDGEEIGDAKVVQGKIVPEEAREVLPPGPTIPLHRLRRTHDARVYVQSRGFDPDEISEKYGICYCTNSVYSFARGRIIIPCYEGGKLKGWQARYVGELDWKGPKRKELPPKYFNTPGGHFKSKVILNFERMQHWHTGVIVEGPTDQWRFGSMAGCIFGNSMSDVQRRKFAAVFKKRAGVLLLDPEESGSKQTADTLAFFEKAMPGRFCAVRLPDGTDPGSLDRDFLREYVREQAVAQGVKVKYKKVA